MSAQPSEAAESRMQEDLLRLDAYRGQLNAMVQQYQYLASSRADHVRARETLEGLDRTQDGDEVLIPVGGDTFLRGVARKDEKVLLGLGAGVIAELERPKVSEVLAQRLTKIEQASRDLEGQIRQLEDRIQGLTERIESASRGPSGEDNPPDDVGRD